MHTGDCEKIFVELMIYIINPNDINKRYKGVEK